jgi:hypothetical protein
MTKTPTNTMSKDAIVKNYLLGLVGHDREAAEQIARSLRSSRTIYRDAVRMHPAGEPKSPEHLAELEQRLAMCERLLAMLAWAGVK